MLTYPPLLDLLDRFHGGGGGRFVPRSCGRDNRVQLLHPSPGAVGSTILAHVVTFRLDGRRRPRMLLDEGVVSFIRLLINESRESENAF